jgi:hypothetical protein
MVNLVAVILPAPRSFADGDDALAFKKLCYDEDSSYLRDLDTRRDPLGRLKFVPLRAAPLRTAAQRLAPSSSTNSPGLSWRHAFQVS